MDLSKKLARRRRLSDPLGCFDTDGIRETEMLAREKRIQEREKSLTEKENEIQARVATIATPHRPGFVRHSESMQEREFSLAEQNELEKVPPTNGENQRENQHANAIRMMQECLWEEDHNRRRDAQDQWVNAFRTFQRNYDPRLSVTGEERRDALVFLNTMGKVAPIWRARVLSTLMSLLGNSMWQAAAYEVDLGNTCGPVNEWLASNPMQRKNIDSSIQDDVKTIDAELPRDPEPVGSMQGYAEESTQGLVASGVALATCTVQRGDTNSDSLSHELFCEAKRVAMLSAMILGVCHLIMVLKALLISDGDLLSYEL